MYARTAHPEAVGSQIINVELPEGTETEEIHYWRKHPNLHGWMEDLYRRRDGSGEFNCVVIVLSPEDIDELEQAVLGAELPETAGFFFGESSAEDREDDLKFIEKARAAHAEGLVVMYDSWW